jgi:branched-chain amino acid transport system permease protein
LLYLLQQLPAVATIGCLYALAAVGYTLIHAVTRQFNLALGGLYVIGAYAAFTAATLLDILGLASGVILVGLALIAGTVTGAAGGLGLLPFSLPRVFTRAHPVAPLVTTIALWIVLAEAVRLLHEPHMLFLTSPVPGSLAIVVGDAEIAVLPWRQILVVPAAAVSLATMLWLIGRTPFGRALRATADDPPAAALIGIDVPAMVLRTFALGAGLSAIAGSLAAIRYGAVFPYMGLTFALKALTAAVIGGVGSPGGAILGAFAIAAVETLWSAYLAGDHRDVVVFGVLIFVLLFRPDGLFARSPVSTIGPGEARR